MTVRAACRFGKRLARRKDMSLRVEHCLECETEHFFCDTCQSRCCDHMGLLLWARVEAVSGPEEQHAASTTLGETSSEHGSACRRGNAGATN